MTDVLTHIWAVTKCYVAQQHDAKIVPLYINKDSSTSSAGGIYKSTMALDRGTRVGAAPTGSTIIIPNNPSRWRGLTVNQVVVCSNHTLGANYRSLN